MAKFSHLHLHSHYSLLQALPKIDALVAEAKKHDMKALALTDNGNLYGAIEFYSACKKAGIKPIIGLDAYVSYKTRFDRQDKERFRLVLLVENEIGYKNLLKLVTASHIDGFYYKPRLDREVLEKFHEGLIAIAPARDSNISSEWIDWYKKTFGKEGFFLGITQNTDMEKILELAKKTNTPVVASQEVFYISPEDKIAWETMLSIQHSEEKIDRDGDFSFMSPAQAEKLFPKEAIENNFKIAERCNLELTLGKWILPTFVVESGLSPDEELKRLTYQGFYERGLSETEEIKTRIEYELGIIKDKGFAAYFLVVGDLLRFARKNGIITTTRGSAGGSMVSYLNYITTINPIEFKVPFERFLNPERPKAPDIDMDIADNRRDDMIAYAKEKYGADRAVQICTFGVMMARAAVRDVARAMGYPYSLGDSIAKMVPFGAQGFPMTIKRALEETPELKSRYETEADCKKIIDMALKIEGCARHISVHAAGVVIAPTDITDYSPIQYDPKGTDKVITQYDMYSITDEYDGVGLLKFDFLGIRNLAILADAIKLAEKIEGVKVDIEHIPLDDKKTFEMLALGETVGLFQLNGDGMTRWLKELKPTTIHDINAMVALYRPGPMQFIPQYIERKHNTKLIKYLDPALEPILKNTYGILVYQDDLLMMAKTLAGYSWAEVDKFRKAVGKKIPKEMAEQKEKFVKGCITASKWPKKKAEEIWSWIEPFAAYGFNKAHSVSYGRVAYQTAYMKANFPAIYMSAVLTAESGDNEQIHEIVTECKRMNIPILPPDINQSFEGFTVIKVPPKAIESASASIRFGLTTIKNFGEGVAAAIITERKNGKFENLTDFLRRIKDKNLNKKSLESLIKSGALDTFGDRNILLYNIDRLLEFHKQEKDTSGQSLFSVTDDIHLERAESATLAQKLLWEKELLGLYISGHPLDSFAGKLKEREVNIKKIKEKAREREPVVLGGIVEEVRNVLTKNGDRMIFMKLADLSDSIEAVAFPKIFEEFADLLRPESCIVVKGTLSNRNGEKSILVDKVKLME